MPGGRGAGHKSQKEQKKRVCLITAPRSALAEYWSSRRRKRRNSSDSDASDSEEKSENGRGERGKQPLDMSA